ncbi:MAG TPA: thymidine kinase [Candidatus Paceibacterota bacterium]|nr:thymidine kinase [Candidatus Paceibacterota bacterium]
MEKRGKLEVITGCMFSGKTKRITEIIAKQKFPRQPECCKPSTDDRGGPNVINTHEGQQVLVKTIPAQKPEEIFNACHLHWHNTERRQLIIIDEAQFFSEKIVDVVQLLIKWSHHIIVVGLDLDFRGEPFGSMPQLMSFADKITKLTATCAVCGQKANRTQRIINGEPAHYEDRLVLIGGSDKYEARCLKHHIVVGKLEIVFS